MLLAILYLVALSAVSLSLVAFFLTHPREPREPAPHGERHSRTRRRRAEARGKAEAPRGHAGH